MSTQPNLKQTTYFTIVPTSDAGFTDQIQQFSSFYKLGLSLGYRYIHTPFKNERSCEAIYDFLGFNNHFVRKTFVLKILLWVQRCKFVDMALNDNLLKENDIKTLPELQTYVNNFAFEISNLIDRKIILKFRLKPKEKPSEKTRSFFNKLIHSQIRDFPDQLNLRSIYFEARRQNPRKTRFIEDKIRILVHIRQGDTTIVETPWQTFIPIRAPKKRKELELTEVQNINDLGFEHILDVDDYYDFVKNFISHFDHDLFSIIVSSDGYCRAFEEIYKKNYRFNFTTDQIEELRKAEISYDQKKFEKFNRLKNSISLIGENDENLFDLIHSYLMADIIITGTQQGMTSKLMANYYDLDNPPIIIFLHKTKTIQKIPNFNNILFLHSEKVKIIPVKLDNFNFEDVIARVREEISDKIDSFVKNINRCEND